MARLGADEFAILLAQIRGPEDAVRVAERVLGKVRRPVIWMTSTCRSPTALYRPQSHRRGQPKLVRDADMAMYQRRNIFPAIRSSMRACTPRLGAHETRNRHEARHRAQNKLSAYQPIVSLETGKLAGFEALARWQHSGRGAISPAKFIPLAEETGLVSRLSCWVFEQACAQMRHWLDCYPLGDDCYISVNISSKQLSHGNLIDEVDAVLRATPEWSPRLRLEITEARSWNTRAGSISWV